MAVIAVVVGSLFVVSSFADMLNTLVATHTSRRRFWFTYQLYLRTWHMTRLTVLRIGSERGQHALLSAYAPVSVLLLLVGWLVQQIIGFGLIWWGIGGVSGADGLWDSLYFSGVVYFTVGFGEIVPVEAVPRIGALIEALLGVLTMALVSRYRTALHADDATTSSDPDMFRDPYDQLDEHGFQLLDYEEARAASAELRRKYDAKLEWLIDELVAPRGFWGHTIGHRYARGYVISRDRA